MILLAAISLAVAVSAAPASAQDPPLPGPGKSAGLKSHKGISLAVPTGRILVGPGPANGEPVFERRTTGSGGMTIVEVSTTPFVPVLRASEVAPAPVVRSDQPASW